MKTKTHYWIVAILFLMVVYYAYDYTNKVSVPLVDEKGNFTGEYSIENILTLARPYKCTFEKEDGVSKISATLYTDPPQVYADFAIQTNNPENKRFSSFFLIKDKVTYTWTSISNLGFKSRVVKSASKNATPREQAQLVGTQDKMLYECKLLDKSDSSLFVIPTYITFTDLK